MNTASVVTFSPSPPPPAPFLPSLHSRFYPSICVCLFLSPSFLSSLSSLPLSRTILTGWSNYLRAYTRPSSPRHPLVTPLPLRDRARLYTRECTSLNKLLFIRPVGEMNLRDSYRTRPDMHDGFESLSLLPNGFPLLLATPNSEVIDRRSVF